APGQATPGQATPGQAAPEARGQDVRPTVTAIPAQATPRPEAPLRLPDAQLRPARPSGAQTFAIVGGPGGDGEVGHTSTHLQGVQLLPRGVPAQKVGTRWWVWALLFVAVAGVGAAVVLLLAKPGSDTPHIPVETVAAAPDTTSAPVDVAPAAAPDVAPEVAAEVATADAAAEIAAADATAPDATEDELHFGTRLVTVPEGAAVLRDKKPLCKTPCLVPWTKDEAPPTLRISLKGYVEIDMQLVRGDHGTEQRLELRKLP
ncbi:MAG: hypothetical protein JNJ59_03040, partial [Deltaproteobacteria bacterium]|nr:hypothetical protein [Deltaproteobacteria bacterium]